MSDLALTEELNIMDLLVFHRIECDRVTLSFIGISLLCNTPFEESSYHCVAN